jgi:predicted nucleic acid-binding protein
MPDQRPVAIANTSPLQYLHQCGPSDLLAKLYQEILVPPAVVQELAAGRTRLIRVTSAALSRSTSVRRYPAPPVWRA